MESMSWSDDMRCLFCDGKLPLYRKITNGQFCSAAHGRAYWKEQERLAVERLTQTHDSLRAYRPAGADAILGIPATTASAPLSNPFYLDGQEYPGEVVPEFARLASNRDQVTLAEFVRYAFPLALDWLASPAASATEPVSFPAGPEIPAESGATPVFLAGFSADQPVAETIELTSSILPAAVKWNRRAVQPLAPASPVLSHDVALHVAPEAPLAMRNPEVATARERVEHPAVLEDTQLETAIEVEPAEITDLEPVAAREAGIAEEAAAQLVESAVRLHEDAARTEDVARMEDAALPIALESVVEETAPPFASELHGEVSSEVHGEVHTEFQSEPEAEPMMAGLAALAMPADSQPGSSPLAVQYAEAVEFLPAAIRPVFAEKEIPAPAPSMAAAVLFARAGKGKYAFTPRVPEIAPLAIAPPAAVTGDFSPASYAPALGSAKMLALVAPRTSASASAPADGSVEAVDVPAAARAPQSLPPSGLAIPAVAEHMPLANIVRYPLRSGGTVPARNEVSPAEVAAQTVGLPGLALGVSLMQEPGLAWLTKLPWNVRKAPPEPMRASAASFARAFPTGVEPNPPRLQLEPVDGSAVPPPPRSFLAFANWTPGDSEGRNAWAHVHDFWAHAPRDLKVLLFAIPVLLSLALHPRLPKFHVTAPTGNASAGLSKNFRQVMAQQMNAMQQNVASRAGVALAEDFRSGLEDWQTHGDLSAAWSFDANGFVRPGSLALYRPSMRLTDYDLQFLGLIDKKALSFVARAEDFQNYYVIKLVVLKPGPLPTIGITRYAVINGKAQNRVDSLAPILAMPDMLYHVDLNVHDDTFLLSLQGKVVDNWSEPRLTRGGVGFFAPRGEESRVRWVQLTHQYDMLGRLCAYLAPYNIPTTNGSW